MRTCVIGVDVALVSDHTAVAVYEPPQGRTDRGVLHMCAQLLQGLPIASQAAKVAATVDLQVSKGFRVVVVVDCTGVGGAVVPPITEACRGKATVVPMIINGATHNRIDGGTWFTPKQLLVSTLQIAFENERLEIRNFKGRDELAAELRAFKTTVSDSGKLKYGNDLRENPHDDRVLAVAIAVCYASESGLLGGGVVTSSSRTPGPKRERSWFGSRGPLSARAG